MNKVIIGLENRRVLHKQHYDSYLSRLALILGIIIRGYRKMKMKIKNCFYKTILLITKSYFFISNKLQKVSFRVKKTIKFHQEKLTKINITDISILIELK